MNNDKPQPGEDEDESTNRLAKRAAEREQSMKQHKTVRKCDRDRDDTSRDNDNGVCADFSGLNLRADHAMRPCWTCPDGTVHLEAFHNLHAHASDFLVAVAEPVARPAQIHQYKLTPYSLYAAVATNIKSESIISVLQRLSKNDLPESVVKFIHQCTERYGRARMVLKHNKFVVESEQPEILRELLADPTIAKARVLSDSAVQGFDTYAKAHEIDENLHFLQSPNNDDEEEAEETGHQSPSQVVSFQIRAEEVEHVKRRARDLDLPLMDEYDFRNDKGNPNIPGMNLRPETRIRNYQERSLAKMFGNGRARSGIIVLPCGAGKESNNTLASQRFRLEKELTNSHAVYQTLTGVAAAQTIKKSVVVVCTNAVSVQQWKSQFQLWTTIQDDRIACFTSDQRDPIHPEGCVLISTYTMLSFGGDRNNEAQKVMDTIIGREWGLLLLDEVHVAPAKTFRRVVGTVKAHCRLGLTATLVREDHKISDLSFLIGPKLYEANWMWLTSQGYLANIQCVEVPCPMTGPFMQKYLEIQDAQMKHTLETLNPAKLRITEYLVHFHEARGDKIILFCEQIECLKIYAKLLKKPMIYGETKEIERQVVLQSFKCSNFVNTICLSKVGDTSIDIPEATIVIQVSSHFGAKRQEAQRMGRILRPKNKAPRSPFSCRFDAFFYTLISSDTKETVHNVKRQQFLIDQGYTFKIATELSALADAEAIKERYTYTTHKQEVDLLQDILNGAS